jgi:hypothetical protein
MTTMRAPASASGRLGSEDRLLAAWEADGQCVCGKLQWLRVLLIREGWQVGKKLVYRVYREKGLGL